MKRLKKQINPFKFELTLLLAAIGLAAFLRFYNITKLEFFTYDQARDAIYVKRIIADGKLRLLGTQTSMPGMFLPPFYYYTIAPILWLFRLNPIGIDIYAALIGVSTIPLIYFVTNKLFGQPAGIFSASLVAVSPIVVEITRRAWNPNTLPFFILLAFCFLYSYFKDGQTKDFLLGFLFYGYCLSLHFGAWTLMPLLLFSWLHFFFKKREWKPLLASCLIIFFFVSPLLLFELRHGFFLISQARDYFISQQNLGFNPLGVLESSLSSLVALFGVLISGKVSVGHGAPLEFSGSLKDLFTLPQPISVVAQKPFSISFQWWGVAIFGLILIWSGFNNGCKRIPTLRREKRSPNSKRKDSAAALDGNPRNFGGRRHFLTRSFKKKSESSPSLGLLMVWVWLLWGIFVSRLYQGGFFFFYYLYLFPIPFLLFGFLAKRFWQEKWLKPLVAGGLVLITGFHLGHTAIFEPNWRDINDLRQVARVIGENAPEEASFNIATLRRDTDFWERNSVDYRYFVETFEKKKALDWYPEDYEKAEFLFVVDETGRTDILKTNVMEILKFDPGKIIGQWEVEKGIKIYKLTKKQ